MSITQETPQTVLEVPEADLDDLRARLRNTRWAREWPLEPWQAGTDGATLRRLVAYWADGFDWRAKEAEINSLPHRFAEIDGVRIHYLHFGAEGGFPLLLANGWPSTFYELTELAARLASDGFTVVVPSLPGFTFSQQRPSLETATHTHELWHRLMLELGFERYGAHGSDLGAAHVGWLAQAHPESVVAIHLLDVDKRAPEGELEAAEQAFVDALAQWEKEEGAYGHEHRTRPLTLAQGLSDSPSGLLAWILEKYYAWSDTHGDLSNSFTDDFLLTQASLYWFTNTISTSFRDYYERGNGHAPTFVHVDVPTAVAWFPADLGAQWPRSWIERKYDLTRYTAMPRGGHFAAREETALLEDDVRTFFQQFVSP